MMRHISLSGRTPPVLWSAKRFPLSQESFATHRRLAARTSWLLGPAVCCADIHGSSSVVHALLEYPRRHEDGHQSQPWHPAETHLLEDIPQVLPAVRGDVDCLHELLTVAIAGGNRRSVAAIIDELEHHMGAVGTSTAASAALSDVSCRAVHSRVLALTYLTTVDGHHSVKGAAKAASPSATIQELLKGTFPTAMPVGMLHSILSIASPHVCHVVLDYQESAITHRTDNMNDEHLRMLKTLDPILAASRCIGGQQVAPLWLALLNNDHFFLSHESTSATARASIHSVLMRFVRSVPSGSVTQQSHAHCAQLQRIDWAAILNKTSRVYLNKKRGNELLELHRLLLDKFSGISLRVPRSYIARLVGALFDEASRLHQQGNTAPTGSFWDNLMGVLRWSMSLIAQDDNVLRSVIAVARKAAVQIGQGGPTEPSSRVCAARLLELYELCVLHRIASPASNDKDSFQQLTRYMSASLFEVIMDAADRHQRTIHSSADVVDLWLTYLENDTSVKFSWVLDALGTLLRSLHDAVAEVTSTGVDTLPGGDEALLVAKELALRLLTTVEGTILPGRNATGVRPRSVPNIRRALESLGVEAPSPFWWTCGCGSANPAISTHCYSCMRRGRVSWKCTSCNVEQSPRQGAARFDACQSCSGLHPRTVAAQRAMQEVCHVCSSVFDPALGDCSVCRVGDDSHGEGDGRTSCQHCGHTMALNSPLCPKCLSRNMLSDVKLWHCNTCHNYSYSTWSRCQRCAPSITSVKPANALTIPFFTWKCGCGSTQHPCKLGCATCTAASPNASTVQQFSCVQCHRRSHLRHSVVQEYGEVSLRITMCQHCAFPHPRDHILLTLPKAVPRSCVSCGQRYIAKQGNGLGPQVCGQCLSLQPINTNLPFACASPSCASSTQWQWSLGLECTSCHTLRSDVAVYCDPFVWKCLAPEVATGSSEVPRGLVSTTAESEGADVQTCQHWNPSWVSQCQTCHAPRPHAPEEEVRAKYLPWTCSSCNVSHSATTVLVCPNCHEGRQPPPKHACTSCGMFHIAWRCPTIDHLIEAERILCEWEDERARQRLEAAGELIW